MADLIFEIFSEEIPARMQANAAEFLRKNFEEKLQGSGVFYRTCKTFVTPRRLALFADGLSLTQEDSVAERKGPRTDANDVALEGFLRSTGLTKDQLTIKATPKGEFYFAIIRQKGRNTQELLKDVLEDILNNFSWPKSMRWGDYQIRWVRPIKNIACIFGNEILDVKFGHLSANDKSFGHRFLSNGSPIKITNFDGYEKDLEKNFVILDQARRKKLINDEVRKLADSKGLKLIEDEGLLNEVAGLVEWPVIMLGEIDPDFMALPEEVLITTVRVNQKYFCLRNTSGKLAPLFIFVANINPVSGNKQIVEGNQRVLRARLSDGKFFFRQDKEKGLENFIPKLSDIIFHAKIGNVLERSERIYKITEEIIKHIAPEKKDLALRAAELCKADLATGMVGEFPELQGVMGFYYALEMGENDVIANAIKDHYKPLGPNDNIPTGSVAIAVALAEKIEGMTALFVAGERATGSKDPFALRRLALGIIRIIVENKVSIELKPLFKKALKLLPSSALKGIDKDEVLEELTEFLIDRLKQQLKDQNSADVLSCILGRSEGLDIISLKDKINTLEAYLKTQEGFAALDAFKRALNILKIEEKKENTEYKPNPSASQLLEGPEKAMFTALAEAEEKLEAIRKENDFSLALSIVAKLPSLINNYFDNTLINTPEKKLRENRLRITALIVSLFLSIADFDRL